MDDDCDGSALPTMSARKLTERHAPGGGPVEGASDDVWFLLDHVVSNWLFMPTVSVSVWDGPHADLVEHQRDRRDRRVRELGNYLLVHGHRGDVVCTRSPRDAADPSMAAV